MGAGPRPADALSEPSGLGQGSAHDFERRRLVEPDFKRKRALMQKESVAADGPSAHFAGGGFQPGGLLTAKVDGVENQVMRPKQARREGQRVAVAQAERRAVHDQVGMLEFDLFAPRLDLRSPWLACSPRFRL